jgi:hypothetical protein
MNSGQPSHSPVITADIGCPKCDYNLRGLSGETVTCPECGSQWHAMQIQVERWERVKDRLPGLLEARAMPAVAIFGVFILAIAFVLIWEEYFSAWAPAGGSGWMARGRLTRDVIIVGRAAIVTVAGFLLLALPVIAFRNTSKKMGARRTARIAVLVLIEYASVIAGMIALLQVVSVGIETTKAIREELAFPMWASTPLDAIVRNAIVPRGIVAAMVILVAVFILRRTNRALRRELAAGLVRAGAHRAYLQP